MIKIKSSDNWAVVIKHKMYSNWSNESRIMKKFTTKQGKGNSFIKTCGYLTSENYL